MALKFHDLTATLYFAFFGMFIVMLTLLVYAPLWLSIAAGLGFSFVGAILINQRASKLFEKKNIFEIARELGKVIVLTFIPPNKVYLFLADKEPSTNSLKIKLMRKGKWETYRFYLSPEQEFHAEIPEQKFKKKEKIWEIINRAPFPIVELTEPSKEVFKLEHQNVEMVFFVYPSEILTKEQLKMLKMVKIDEQEKEIEINTENGIKREKIKVPVYAPQPYVLNSDMIKQLSAHTRLSQLHTTFEQSRELMQSAEKVVGGAVGKIGSAGMGIIDIIKSNKSILILLILLIGGFLMFAVFSQLFGHMSSQIGSFAAEKLAQQTGATKFP